MNATQLLNADGTPAGIWVCSECRHVTASREVTERCCRCSYCNKTVDQSKGRTAYHMDCFSADQAERDQKRMAKAEKLDIWDGWVYLDGHGHNEGFFRDLQELAECLDDELADGDLEVADWPEYAWICNPRPIRIPDLADLIERICDDGYEGLEDDLEGLDELGKALDVFAKVNAGLFDYLPSSTQAVAVPKPSEELLLKLKEAEKCDTKI